MKILLVSDSEVSELWENWTDASAARLADVDLILSAGDLHPAYLEFIETMSNVPLVYVRGNHDSLYEEEPPEGCICAEDEVVVVNIPGERSVRIAGLGGSMRYREGTNMYTEGEMKQRVRHLGYRIRRVHRIEGLKAAFREQANEPVASRRIDILLTHAPCKGFGDMEDLPHQGFDCFNGLLEKEHPLVHCHGHVHAEYGNFTRESEHPSGTRIINGSGMYIFEM
ncbi:MAG: metallophosphoesterase [Mogibacterium sp.]|nr:metallophosphoesterase [Mogibacterium sp.]